MFPFEALRDAPLNRRKRTNGRTDGTEARFCLRNNRVLRAAREQGESEKEGELVSVFQWKK